VRTGETFIRDAEELKRLGVAEIVSDKLYAVGGMVKLDGRVSWAPSTAVGYQPTNSYVLIENDTALIVDPGLASHGTLVKKQLRALLPNGSGVLVFLTRAELDCVGNLGNVALSYRIKQLFTSGVRNPFDSFEYATFVDPELRASPVKLERQPVGFKIPIAGSRTFEVVLTQIRLLATFWGYDSLTKTLFTSDTFVDGTLQQSTDSRIVDSAAADTSTDETARDHLHAKFWWLQRADKKDAIRRTLREVFEMHDVQIIAPSRGTVLRGKPVVTRHYDQMIRILGEG
jgi:flavorubredoxin